MKRAIIYILCIFFPIAGLADECKVTNADEFFKALDSVQRGECKTNLAEYRNRYNNFFPGKTTFQVIKIVSEITISTKEKLTINGNYDEPMVITSSTTNKPKLTGEMQLKGSGIIIDRVSISTEKGTPLTIDADNSLIMESQIGPSPEWGIRVNGKNVGVVASEILENGEGGMIIEGESANLFGNVIHDNGKKIKSTNCSNETTTACKSLSNEKTFCAEQIEETKLKTRCTSFLSTPSNYDGSRGAIGGAGILIDSRDARIMQWKDAAGKIYNNKTAGIYINSIPVENSTPDGLKNLKIADLQTAKTSKQLMWNNNNNDIAVSRFPLPAPTKIAIIKDGQSLILKGSIELGEEWNLWNRSSIDINSLIVEIYSVDKSNPIYLGQAKPSKDGTFEISTNTNKTAFRAIEIDEEHNNSSEFGAQSSSQAGSANDADGDGLSDELEIKYMTDPSNPDSDGDGVIDGEEILIGTDPNKIDTDGDCLPDGVEVGITKETAQKTVSSSNVRPKYVMTSKCLSWLEKFKIVKLENVILYNPSLPATVDNISIMFDLDPLTTTDSTEADTDRDRLRDGEEDKNFNGKFDKSESDFYETDPTKSDTDGDSISDGDEDRNLNGTKDNNESNPNLVDSDGDGLDDGTELRLGTLSHKCDTDDDGLSDGVEKGATTPFADSTSTCRGLSAGGTNYKNTNVMNPLNPDSDGDGLRDGEEDKNGNGWVDADESDPSTLDTDGDGIDDRIETKGDSNGDKNPDFDVRLLKNGKGCSPPTNIFDVDCDGIPNFVDEDSDNDGCTDSAEGKSSDLNSDGIPDFFDGQIKNCQTSSGGTYSTSSSPTTNEKKKTDEQKKTVVVGSDGDPMDNPACSLVTTYEKIRIFNYGSMICALIAIIIARINIKRG